MPEGLEGVRFYHPDDAEASLAAALERVRAERGRGTSR
jgi:hypothetical protein